MILCLDIGNSHLYGGVFNAEKNLLTFRYPSEENHTSDQLGIFLRSVLKENNINFSQIKKISFCSVAPSLNYTVCSAFIKYFNIQPFELKPGVKTGLKIRCKNPTEVGTDRIANAIATAEILSNKNCIVIDFGTATTLDVISSKAEYLGGAILPGIKMSMQALCNNTEKLPSVPIIKPKNVLGQTTTSNIQSGLYYGHLGAIQNLIQKLTNEFFTDASSVHILGTGGFAHLFSDEGLLHQIIPDLGLQGLKIALHKNTQIT